MEGGGRGKGSIEKRKVWGKEESKGDRKISWKGK